tara:strand:+ start:239 stop:406 length:168 start_codon:yes stop_codon:yes gene_type:complete
MCVDADAFPEDERPSTHGTRQRRSQTAKQIACAGVTFVQNATHANEAKECINIAR